MGGGGGGGGGQNFSHSKSKKFIHDLPTDMFFDLE